jgi:hypothetical protein
LLVLSAAEWEGCAAKDYKQLRAWQVQQSPEEVTAAAAAVTLARAVKQ